MAVLQEFKCPCCDGGITFDSATQKMKCPYCDTEFDVETLVNYQQELAQEQPDDMSWQNTPQEQWHVDETSGLRVYICETCSGEVVGDETLGATACPFCGNPVVMKGQFAGDLMPDLVIPFKLDKEAAKAALLKHYSGKPLLPKIFKSQNHIQEVKGVYVPFWLFDTDAQANIRYKATRVRTWSDSNYYYTETKHYSVIRGGSLGFKSVPVDGSTKMDDTLMESIEPFELSGAVEFNPGYLSGYLADRYDVDAENSIDRANTRIKSSTEAAFAATVQGFSTVVPVASNIQLNNGQARYALYPVWLLITTWAGKKYTFAMNGQTGKLVGDLPMDKGAFWRWFLGITGIATAACFAISWLLWLL